MSVVKDEAVKVIQDLPETATWEDVTYAVYVRECIEQGTAEIEAGHFYTQEEVERRIRERLRAAP